MHIAHHGVSYKIEYHGNIEKEFGRVHDGFESCQKRGQKSRDTLPLEMESNHIGTLYTQSRVDGFFWKNGNSASCAELF